MTRTKNNDNTFTGVFMGSVKEPGAEKEEHGLFGYNSGQRTITLNSEDGSARFGKAGAGQIIIDPTQNTAQLKSGDYVPAEYVYEAFDTMPKTHENHENGERLGSINSFLTA